MTLDHTGFQRLLEIHGADPTRWPEGERQAALDLVARSEVAKALMERAGRLDALLVRGLEAEAGDALRARIVAGARTGRRPAAGPSPVRHLLSAPWRIGFATAAAASVALGIFVGLETRIVADPYAGSAIATDLTAATYGQVAALEDIP